VQTLSIAAAKRFFSKAIERHGDPQRIRLDGSPAPPTAIAAVKKEAVRCPQTKVWTSKYLNNLVEHDHRRVKQRIYPRLGFKNFVNAAVTISGLELVQKIRKGPFDTSRITTGTGTPVVPSWGIVIAA
jgi:transposase-like protein